MRLGGRVAVVTGGAKGNGAAIALGLAAEGADVVAADLDAAGAEEVARRAAEHGVRALGLEVDVADAGQVRGLVAEVRRRFGALHVLVNNAGVMVQRPFLELTEADWDAHFAVNARGLFLASLEAARTMRDGGGGAIVNVSSMAAEIAPPNTAVYAATKGAVRQLTRAMAVDLAPYGIRVNAIEPGVIETDMTRAILADPERKARSLARIPLGRVGTPEDLAGAVAFLASDDARYITGASIRIDGGYLAR